jgi:hypothetical protein
VSGINFALEAVKEGRAGWRRVHVPAGGGRQATQAGAQDPLRGA